MLFTSAGRVLYIQAIQCACAVCITHKVAGLVAPGPRAFSNSQPCMMAGTDITHNALAVSIVFCGKLWRERSVGSKVLAMAVRKRRARLFLLLLTVTSPPFFSECPAPYITQSPADIQRSKNDLNKFLEYCVRLNFNVLAGFIVSFVLPPTHAGNKQSQCLLVINAYARVLAHTSNNL